MSDADYLKCSCQKCGGHIEFPPDGTGELIDCPHCGEQTILVSTPEKIPDKSGKKFAISAGLVLLALIFVTAGVILYGSMVPKPTVLAQTATPQTITNAVKTNSFTELNDFKISNIALKKSEDGGLVYAVGTVKNDTTRQRFGVKIELALLDEQDDKIGSASDYIADLEPQGEWQFKALLTELKAVNAKLANIEEQK
jgi:predicted RNA-binding Zn-ribbon protein involved in translation (DUF1610 family)